MTNTTAPSDADTDVAAIEAELAEHPHGRVPRALRRRQILATAQAMFVERGYTATSMDDLAGRLGVSKPVIYDLVGSKERLFEVCVEAVADDLAVAVAAAVETASDADPDDPSVGLRAGALAWFEFIGDRRGLWEALLSSTDAPTTAAVRSIRARQDRYVAEQLLEASRDAGLDPDPTLADAVATAMNGAFEALGRWWHDHPDRTAAELADLYTALVLPGLQLLLQLPDA